MSISDSQHQDNRSLKLAVWRLFLFLVEHCFFALALISMVPAVPSDRDDAIAYITSPTNIIGLRIGLSCGLLFISRITAMFAKKETLPGALCKVAILFAVMLILRYVIHQYAVAFGGI